VEDVQDQFEHGLSLAESKLKTGMLVFTELSRVEFLYKAWMFCFLRD